jgi:hypothetical protein
MTQVSDAAPGPPVLFFAALNNFSVLFLESFFISGRENPNT